MKLSIHLSLLILTLLGSSFTHAAPARIHPLVSKAQDHAKARKQSFANHPSAITAKPSATAETFTCFVQTSDVAALKKRGWFGGTEANGIATAVVPAGALGELASLPGVTAILPSTRKEPLLDVSSSNGTLNGAYLGINARDIAPTSERGEGVIVGVVDSGIDFRHKDFIYNDSETTNAPESRIISIWDQTLTPLSGEASPVGFDRGIEYTRQQINGALAIPATAVVRSVDDHGHGTHVTGTAAGDGSDNDGSPTGSIYQGIASGAEIISVKTTFLDTDILDGVNYIFTKAQALGRPCVVNLSLGSQFGSHDGREAAGLGKLLSDLVGPGKLIAAAMGNDRGQLQHIEGTVSGSQSFSFIQSAGTLEQVITLWHHKDDAYSISVTSPDGTTPVRTAGGSTTYALGANSVEIYNAANATMTQSDGDKNIIVYLSGPSSAQANWSINLTRTSSGGNGDIDAWFALTGDGGEWNSPNESELVASPADGEKIIKVAAYAARNSYPWVHGGTIVLPSPTLGALATFSSPGPLRRESASNPNPTLAPDLAAPGHLVGASLSRNAIYSDSTYLDDGRHCVLSGTSMATPHVTGALAIALQYHPTLTIEEFRTLISTNASTDPNAPVRRDIFASSANTDFGHGKLNADGIVRFFRPLAAREWERYE